MLVNAGTVLDPALHCCWTKNLKSGASFFSHLRHKRRLHHGPITRRDSGMPSRLGAALDCSRFGPLTLYNGIKAGVGASYTCQPVQSAPPIHQCIQNFSHAAAEAGVMGSEACAAVIPKQVVCGEKNDATVGTVDTVHAEHTRRYCDTEDKDCWRDCCSNFYAIRSFIPPKL